MTLRPLYLVLAASTLALAVTPALADNGKGNSNGHGKNQGAATQTAAAKSNHGALASELKGLNAAHASETALANAAPNSRVGRIATYRDAALLTLEKIALRDQAQADLDALPVPTRSVEEIDAAIALLDPLALDYATTLAALEAEKQAAADYAAAAALRDAAQAEADAAAALEDEALLTASDGRVLSDEALAYLRSLLNL